MCILDIEVHTQILYSLSSHRLKQEGLRGFTSKRTSNSTLELYHISNRIKISPILTSSMSRKHAGTSTATRSPLPKKARNRTASASSSKSTKKKKMEKKVKAAPEPRLAPSKLKAKPVPKKASEKALVSGKGKKNDVHAQGSPDLEDNGLEIVSNDELQGSEDSREGGDEGIEVVEMDDEAELGA